MVGRPHVVSHLMVGRPPAVSYLTVGWFPAVSLSPGIIVLLGGRQLLGRVLLDKISKMLKFISRQLKGRDRAVRAAAE